MIADAGSTLKMSVILEQSLSRHCGAMLAISSDLQKKGLLLFIHICMLASCHYKEVLVSELTS
jgi:hypothetical protein